MMEKKNFDFGVVWLFLIAGVMTALPLFVLLVLNPVKKNALVRNAQRQSDIYNVLSACRQYASSRNGVLPDSISNTPSDVGTGALNLADYLVPAHIPSIPYDPSNGDETLTEYVLFKEANGRLTASASSAELGETITITR